MRIIIEIEGNEIVAKTAEPTGSVSALGALSELAIAAGAMDAGSAPSTQVATASPSLSTAGGADAGEAAVNADALEEPLASKESAAPPITHDAGESAAKPRPAKKVTQRTRQK